MVIAVLGGAKIAVANSLLGAVMKMPTVTLALVDSVDEQPHRDEPDLRFEREGWGLWWGHTCAADWGAAQQRQRLIGFMWRGEGRTAGRFPDSSVPPGKVFDHFEPESPDRCVARPRG